MTKQPSHNRRFIMTKNLIMMLVVLVVGLLAVWSWFTVNQRVEANTITVRAAYPNEVSLAKVLKTYTNGTLEKEGPDVFSGSIQFNSTYQFTKDCTGDGKTLIVPDFSVLKDKEEAIKKGRIVNLNGAWEEALSNNEVAEIKAKDSDAKVEARYMECEFYARSTTKNINLMPDSKLISETESNNSNLSTYTTAKKSSYGDFNVDGLVGAVRVALVCQGASDVQQTIASGEITKTGGKYNTQATLSNYGEEVTMLWVPRPDVKLNPDPHNSGATNDWSLTTGVSSGDTYAHNFFQPAAAATGTNKYAIRVENYDGSTNDFGTDSANCLSKNKGTGVQEVAGTDVDHNVVVSSSSVTPTTYATLGQETNVSNFKTQGYNDSLSASSLARIPNQPYTSSNSAYYYVYKYKLRIWIEGTDSEARRAMDGGSFSLDLKFK